MNDTAKLTGCLIVLLVCTAAAVAEEPDYATLAREFVTKCLSDTNVFVYNPPAGQNPYKDMAPTELQTFQQRTMRSGAVLFLQPSGLPGQLKSRQEYKEHGLHKTWHQNGRTRTEEIYNHENLVTGIYFDSGGMELSRIENGMGTRIIFDEAIGQHTDSINGTAEYQDGVKHGPQILYADYEAGIRRSEEHFRKGERHGVKTTWRPSGGKNTEQHFRNGKPHGKALYWYENGQLQSSQDFDEGTRIGAFVRFFENGTKATERSDSRHREWFPSGQLMLDKTLGEGGKVTSAVSFDSRGNTNGVISHGQGILIYGNGHERFEQYLMEIHQKDRTPHVVDLPRPHATCSYSSNVVNMTIVFKIPPGATWEHGTLSLILPPGTRADTRPTFVAGNMKSGYSADFGPVTITLPEPVVEWNGTILADVDGTINGHGIRYQQPIFSGDPKMGRSSATQRPIRPPRPFRVPSTSIRRGSAAPRVEGKIMLPYREAAAHWRLSKREWILYQSPALLLISDDGGDSWRIARSDFSYRPQTLEVGNQGSIFMWGTKPTGNTSNGIPYVVEKSMDGGESWKAVTVPEVDFLLGLGGNEEALMMTGSRIPKGGIPHDKDWFELPRVTFISQDGINFTEIVGPSFSDIEKIKTKSIAPNGEFRAFLSVSSWLDTSYGLYLAKGHDELPVAVISPPAGGELVWSGNSRILAVRNGSQLVAYVDTTSGDSEKAPLPYARASSDKEEVECAQFDTRVRSLMADNTLQEPWQAP